MRFIGLYFILIAIIVNGCNNSGQSGEGRKASGDDQSPLLSSKS
jgi:hypothetical protein